MGSGSRSRRRTDLHVVLYEPEIHWNTGNVGRTCLAAGASLHLIEPLGFSLDEREVRRAGLDYWDRVPVTSWPGWVEFESKLPSLGRAMFFTAKATTNLWDAPLAACDVLVFGPETRGLPDSILKRYADSLVSIPIAPDSVRSLNLSTAVAVALYEALRQKRVANR